MSNPLVTITISIERNGDIFEDTQCHGNSWAEVYRGLHQVKERLNFMIDERRKCPFFPRKGK